MKKKILIIGGMGPQASVTLHQKIIKHAAQNGATNCDQFPTIIHVSMPVPEFIDSSAGKSKAFEVIKEQLYCLWQPRIYSYCNSLQYRTPTVT